VACHARLHPRYAARTGSASEPLLRLGVLAVAWGDLEDGARLLGAAESAGAGAYDAYDSKLHERVVRDLRRALGDQPLEAARSRGHAMTLDEGVEYALGGVARAHVKGADARSS
jgi:hypothetical protein